MSGDQTGFTMKSPVSPENLFFRFPGMQTAGLQEKWAIREILINF